MLDLPQYFADVEDRVGRPPEARQRGNRPAPIISQGISIVERWRRTAETESVALPPRPIRVRIPAGNPADPVPGIGNTAEEIEFDWDWEAKFEGFGTETLACYLPWHVFRPVWGIVLNQASIDQYAQRVAAQCCCSLNEIRPLVTRQIIEHEFVHFDFEVLATRIEDALGTHRYVEYLWHRYYQTNQWTDGALEEVVATWAEHCFSKKRRQAMPNGIKPAGYARTTTVMLRRTPAGYRDFEVMRDAGTAEELLRQLVGAIANDPGMIASGLYPSTGPDDRTKVPIYWDADTTGYGDFGLARSVSPIPKIKEFESWVKGAEGGKIVRGKNHDQAVFANGRTSPYSRPKPTDRLRKSELSNIAERAGLSSPKELNFCVAESVSVSDYVSCAVLLA